MSRDDAGRITLCQGLDGLRFRQHAILSGKQGLDPGTKARPVILGQVEMAAEVEQGDLANLLTRALGGDEPVGEV